MRTIWRKSLIKLYKFGFIELPSLLTLFNMISFRKVKERSDEKIKFKNIKKITEINDNIKYLNLSFEGKNNNNKTKNSGVSLKTDASKTNSTNK